MSEFDEFAEALFGQLGVELQEEEEIQRLDDTISTDSNFDVVFDAPKEACSALLPDCATRASTLLGLPYDINTRLDCPELKEFKIMKSQKVYCSPESRSFVDGLFTAVADDNREAVAGMMRADPVRYLAYSTYVIQYISKITTTYGDYTDGTIFMNGFILARYPRIILYKMGIPYGAGVKQVTSGYRGALKMALAEEAIHSMQGPLLDASREAATNISDINERLAGIVMEMEEEHVVQLSAHLGLQKVPDDFPFARSANLFFALNPDRFLREQFGSDVMRYTHVRLDENITRHLPHLHDMYTEWMESVQRHQAALQAREGMVGHAVGIMFEKDPDFAQYLTMFAGTDMASYNARRVGGAEFVRHVFAEMNVDGFARMLESPPSLHEIRNPEQYVRRLAA